ncbi:MAG: beta-lactamase family protein [Acidiferrobacterales bacterium]|nr:beta-lactamase family protein [Acidiferrobacterales bacterium]
MIKKIFVSLLCLPILGVIALLVTGHGYILTAVERTYLQGNTTANINDYSAFNTHEIASNQPSELPKAENYNQHALADDTVGHLEKYGTAAFLVVKDGEVFSEHYFNDYHARSKTNSFSMAKTVLTLLIGIAIEDGYIESLNQNLIDFLPEFKDDLLANKATIEQLSLMNSGYEWTEHYYTPFSPTVELLYGHDVEDFLLDGYFSSEPGSYFEYSSASTQLLGIVLKRALEAKGNTQTISEYLSEKIWQPMQMNDNALWHTDNSGMELVFCCINTNARNFAKLGLLMLNNGIWNNQQLIAADFIETMTKPVGADYYGYSTWLNTLDVPSYYWFSGHLGQYIIVIPDYNMVVVRLGETRDPDENFRTVEIPLLIKQALMIVDLDKDA